MFRKISLMVGLLLASLTQINAQELTIWGYNTSNEFTFMGSGSGSDYPDPISCAMYVPGNGELKGAKIHALNLPITSDDYTDISIWGVNKIVPYSESLGTLLFNKKYTGPVMANTYQRVDLDTPIEIPEEGLYVGFTYTTNSGYPFGMIVGCIEGSTWDNTWNGWWVDDRYNTTALQIFISNVSLTGNFMSIESAKCRKSESGKEAFVTVGLSSSSNEPVETLTYTVTFGSKKETRTITLDEPIEEGLTIKVTKSLGFTAPATDGTHKGTISIDKINGKDNLSEDTSCEFTVKTVAEIVPRLTIIEEYTGTGCGNCPRGWLGMKNVKEKMSDHAAVIAIHQYPGNDPMMCYNYSTMEFDGAPSCHIDRTGLNLDPLYGDALGNIYERIDDYNDIDATAKVEVEGHFTDATNSSISVSATTKFLTNSPGSQIAFVLTADELTGTSNAWRQSNYFYDWDAAGNGELGIFCAGGEYGQSYVFLTYDDVLVGSSWDAKGNSSAPAFSSCALNAQETLSMTLPFTPKGELLKAIHHDKIYVTALVIAADGKISNAARSRVLTAGDTTSLTTVATETTPATQRTYDLQGRTIGHQLQQRGLYITNGRKIIGQ